MGIYGYLKEGTPFNQIFPDGRVPLQSIFSAIPREEVAPPCYWVNGSKLTNSQTEELARLLYQQWSPELPSLEEAIAYIRKGLPLNTDWFKSVTTDNLFFLGDEGDDIDEFVEQDLYELDEA